MAIEAVVSQLNGNALGKALANSEGAAKTQQSGSSFKDVMSQMDDAVSFARQFDLAGTTDAKPDSKMLVLQGDQVAFQPGDQVNTAGPTDMTHKVADMLGDVNKSQVQMDSLMNNILYSGKRFSNQELLCMQAYVFQHAQTVELTVKLTDQSVSSVKSVLNTQIQ